jgi:hypothetical protein
MPGISYTLGLDSRPGIAGLAAMRSALSGFNGMVGKLGPLAGLAGGLGVAGAAVAGFKKAIDEAAQMEGLETGFQVMLGSAQAATARMRELAQFAAATPFELPEIAQASRNLETLTRGALSTGNGLTLVGDVASATQQPFNELATTIGRLYDGIQSGRAVGDAMARLQELGTISGEVRAQIEQMQQQGRKGADVWAPVAAELSRFSGMMDVQSRTWNGLLSTLHDNVNAAFRELGSPVLPQLKPLLTDAIGQAGQLGQHAREWGAQIAQGIAALRSAGAGGKLGQVVGLSLKVGFLEAADALVQALATGIVAVRDELTALMNQLAGRATSIGLQMASVLKDAMAASLPAVGVLKGAKAGLHAGAAGDRAAAKGLNLALSTVQGMNVTPIVDFFTKDLAETQDQLAKLFATLTPALKPVTEQLTKAAAALADSTASTGGIRAPQMIALGDRLSKIGGFIGGSGGVRGQKAAEDTARNTSTLVNLTRTMSDRIGALRPTSGSAVF